MQPDLRSEMVPTLSGRPRQQGWWLERNRHVLGRFRMELLLHAAMANRISPAARVPRKTTEVTTAIEADTDQLRPRHGARP